MLQMEIDDVGAVAHVAGVQANIGAIEMKAGQIIREPNSGIATDDNEVLVQTDNAFRKLSDALVLAVRIADAQR